MPELTYREAVRDALAAGDARGRRRLHHGRGHRRDGRLDGRHAGDARRVRRRSACATRRSPRWRSSAPAIGAAMQGMRPVVEIMYEDFMTLAMEQIVNQAAKHRYMSGGQLKVPLTIRTQGGAGWSPGAQHAQQVEAWFVHVPGPEGRLPSTPEDVRGLLWSSIYDDNPVIFFEHRTLYAIKERGARGARADPARAGARPPRGRGRDRRRDRPARARGARGRRGGGEGGRLGRGRRPAHAAAARRGRRSSSR